MAIPRAHRVQLSYASGNYASCYILAKVINGFTGYSVALESIYIYSTDNIFNLGNGMAIDVSLGPNNVVRFPNITNQNADSSYIFARVPLNSAVTLPPPGWETGGFVAYQNPCPYESRTKVILKVNDVDSYSLGLITARGDSIVGGSMFVTLIFYDDSTGNDFIPPPGF
jgi:hypothetical protein